MTALHLVEQEEANFVPLPPTPKPLSGLAEKIANAVDARAPACAMQAAEALAINLANAKKLPKKTVDKIAKKAIRTVGVCLRGNHSPYSTAELVRITIEESIAEAGAN